MLIRRSAVIAATLLAFPASAHAARVPDLTGMTVARAARALTKAKLAPEAGERLELRKRGTRTPEFLRRASRRVTGQSIKPGTEARAGTTVVVTTSSTPGREPSFNSNEWSQIAFERGRITLRGLQKWGDCVNYDHATLGPPANGVRTITVWLRDFGVRKHACDPRPRAFVLHPGQDWTLNTIAVPRLPSAPNPALSSRQRVAKVAMMLEPDRQTVFATFGHGACDDVAGASGTLQGTTGVIRVVIGAEPSWDGVCTLQVLFGAVLVRLPAPLPPGGKLVSAPCRDPDQPGIPEDTPCYEG